jgi:hypothetical protein
MIDLDVHQCFNNTIGQKSIAKSKNGLQTSAIDANCLKFHSAAFGFFLKKNVSFNNHIACIKKSLCSDVKLT